MAIVKAVGPVGALLALSNLDIEMFGVRHRSFRSGKIVSNGYGYGESSLNRYYINGNACSRKDALSRISKFVNEGEEITIEGALK